ncbi:MAG TPA: hypothetical protein VIH71_15890 [Solirubrobacteraceae bacterium]
MTWKLRGALALAAVLTIAAVTTAGATSVKLKPVNGATYAGVVHSETITVKVAANGKTATVKLPAAPGFCQGGSGPEKQSSKAAAISKSGSLTTKISYSSAIGSDHKPFATVTVQGHFYIFSGSAPVFDGTVKSSFVAAGSKTCDGQESFEAIKR